MSIRTLSCTHYLLLVCYVLVSAPLGLPTVPIRIPCTKPFKVCPNLPLFSRVPPLFLPCGERCTPTVFIVLSVRATLPYIQFYGLLWIVTLSVLVCTPNRPYTAFQRDTTVCRLSFPFGSVPIHHRPGLLNPRHSESRHAPTSRLLKAHSGHSLNCNPIFLASCSAPF